MYLGVFIRIPHSLVLNAAIFISAISILYISIVQIWLENSSDNTTITEISTPISRNAPFISISNPPPPHKSDCKFTELY